MTTHIPDSVRTVYRNTYRYGPQIKVYVGNMIHAFAYDVGTLASVNHQKAVESALRCLTPAAFDVTRVGGWTPKEPEDGDYAVFVPRASHRLA